MAYMTFKAQIKYHLEFLRSMGLSEDELKVNKGFIRCTSLNQTDGRGEFCYKTIQTLLQNGMTGLITWCRSKGGKTHTYKTYGLPPNNLLQVSDFQINNQLQLEAARKAKIFWDKSNLIGESDYLRRQGVGFYGIRFRDNEYGRVAVIPMRDIENALWSYQLINSDGTKRVPKNSRLKGLFHSLHSFVNGQPIGIAESYAVAATCFEVSGISTVVAFSSSNLASVAVELRRSFPNSPIIVFADNDRHLEDNKGVKAGYYAQKVLGGNCTVMIPDFEGLPVSKDFSDWNDYVREKGYQVTRKFIGDLMRK